MMKKISRLAALFAATALLFGAIGCSDEDEGGSGEGNKSITLKAGDIFATEDNTLYVKILEGNKVDAFMWMGEKYDPVAEGASFTITGNALSVNAGETETFTGTVVSATQITLTIGKDTMTLKKADKEPTEPRVPDLSASATNVTFDLAKTGPYKDALMAIFDGGDGATAVKPTSDTELAGSDGVTKLVVGNDGGSNISFKYNQGNGFTIKTGNAKSGNALTAKGLKGKVKITVTWAIAGKKAANDRSLTLKAGDQTDTKGNVDTSNSDAATSVDNTCEVTYDFGTTGGDATIDATNEIVVKTIVIVPAE